MPIVDAPHPSDNALQAPFKPSVKALLAVAPAARGVDWLRTSLQQAIELEHATLPLYLTAAWSIESGQHVRSIIDGIISDEMTHMGLACNMLVAIGGTPHINFAGFVPNYPCSLPGGVLPGLTLTLAKLTPGRVRDQFMPVERPARPAAAAGKSATYPSIGEFYDAIAAAFQAVDPKLSTSRQLSSPIGGHVVVMKTLSDVLAAITRISEEGEGTHIGPDSPDPTVLAHYYKFRTIYEGKQLIKTNGGKWAFAGPDIPWPTAIRDMAEVPPGGYGDVTLEFNCAYSQMLDALHDAWATGSPGSLNAGVAAMFQLEGLAAALMHKPLPGRPGNYGPDFRYLPPGAR